MNTISAILAQAKAIETLKAKGLDDKTIAIVLETMGIGLKTAAPVVDRKAVKAERKAIKAAREADFVAIPDKSCELFRLAYAQARDNYATDKSSFKTLARLIGLSNPMGLRDIAKSGKTSPAVRDGIVAAFPESKPAKKARLVKKS